jgi:hypothetical protein
VESFAYRGGIARVPGWNRSCTGVELLVYWGVIATVPTRNRTRTGVKSLVYRLRETGPSRKERAPQRIGSSKVKVVPSSSEVSKSTRPFRYFSPMSRAVYVPWPRAMPGFVLK